MLNSAERLIEPSGTMDVGDDEVPVVVFESWLTCHKIIVTFMFNCRCYLAFGIHISELSVQVFFYLRICQQHLPQRSQSSGPNKWQLLGTILKNSLRPVACLSIGSWNWFVLELLYSFIFHCQGSVYINGVELKSFRDIASVVGYIDSPEYNLQKELSNWILFCIGSHIW